MRAIKRYYANWGLKTAEYYKNKLNKAVADIAEFKNLGEKLRRELYYNLRRIQFLNARNETLTNELNEVKRVAEQTREAAAYFRDKMLEADKTVLIFKYSIDEFLNRHPEFTAEFDKIIIKESESEETED